MKQKYFKLDRVTDNVLSRANSLPNLRLSLQQDEHLSSDADTSKRHHSPKYDIYITPKPEAMISEEKGIRLVDKRQRLQLLRSIAISEESTSTGGSYHTSCSQYDSKARHSSSSSSDDKSNRHISKQSSYTIEESDDNRPTFSIDDARLDTFEAKVHANSYTFG
ncbi:MAG: hypothetical protein U0X86_000088 [Wolbachia endosymbiont of Xenopsylla cheopis]